MASKPQNTAYKDSSTPRLWARNHTPGCMRTTLRPCLPTAAGTRPADQEAALGAPGSHVPHGVLLVPAVAASRHPLRDRRAHTAASTRRQARKHLLTPSGCDVSHGVQLAPAAAHIFSFCFSPPLHNRRAPTVELEARAVKPENATWQPHAPSRTASACSCCKARALATGHTSGCTWKMPSQRRPAAAPAAAASTHSRCTPGGPPWAHPECCMPKAILLAAPAAAASTRAQQKCQWAHPECCVPHSALLVCLQLPAAAASTHSHCATGSTLGAPRVLRPNSVLLTGLKLMHAPLHHRRTPGCSLPDILLLRLQPLQARTHSCCTPRSTMGAP